VKPGRVLFEMAGADIELMREALKLATYKLPLKCKIVTPEI
jgi:large subunit ribosomal protein L16